MVNVIEAQDESDAPEQVLERCEAVLYGAMRRELEACASVGAQLAKIRENELYRVAGADSFELYCRRDLELSAGEVRRFIEVSEVVETLRGVELQLPLSETQAAMLSKISRARLPGFWQTVLSYCAQEEMVPSDGLVRRGVRFELGRAKANEKLVSSREGEPAEQFSGSNGVVEVDLKL